MPSESKARMTAPIITTYQERLERAFSPYADQTQTTFDPQSMAMIDEIFALMRRLKPSLDNGGKELWLVADRGPIEDFGDVNEWIEEGYADDEDEFRRNWLAEYPDERVWYGLIAIEDEKYGIRALSLGHKTIYSWSKHMETIGKMEVTPFIAWVLESVKGCVAELEAGTYNARIEAELPVRLRTGTIRRKDFWDVFPEQRADFFKDITREEINEFAERISQQPDDSREFKGRVQELTANTFYGYCALGYAANHYKCSELTPKEQYYRHADGRDDGLRDIDPDSPEAFLDWCHNRERGGHPFEVCRGGNSTHISLYVTAEDDGYFISLAGDAWNRTVETIKFYLALCRADVPVYLFEGKTLVERVLETEKIGIVPDGVFPDYCSSRFPEEHIIDFMNLPYEEADRIAALATWQPIKASELLQ